MKKQGLSKDQLRLLSCIGEGMQNKAIAFELKINQKAAENRIIKLYHFLNTKDRSKLIRMAIAFGLCSPL